jgi:hypothetical protein
VTSPTIKNRRVPASVLRQLFNEGRFWERVQSGELLAFDERGGKRHPSAPLAREPFCTMSIMQEYRTRSGLKVARVHFYRRTDGTLGAGGMPDPKSLLIDDTLYIVDGH